MLSPPTGEALGAFDEPSVSSKCSHHAEWSELISNEMRILDIFNSQVLPNGQPTQEL
jgi:hypothetical protein